MKTSTLIIVIAVVLAVLIIGWVVLTLPQVPRVAEPLPEAPDAFQELTEGTTVSDIEQDLQLLEAEALFGDLDEELLRLEQELEAEGL